MDESKHQTADDMPWKILEALLIKRFKFKWLNKCQLYRYIFWYMRWYMISASTTETLAAASALPTSIRPQAVTPSQQQSQLKRATKKNGNEYHSRFAIATASTRLGMLHILLWSVPLQASELGWSQGFGCWCRQFVAPSQRLYFDTQLNGCRNLATWKTVQSRCWHRKTDLRFQTQESIVFPFQSNHRIWQTQIKHN